MSKVQWDVRGTAFISDQWFLKQQKNEMSSCTFCKKGIILELSLATAFGTSLIFFFYWIGGDILDFSRGHCFLIDWSATGTVSLSPCFLLLLPALLCTSEFLFSLCPNYVLSYINTFLIALMLWVLWCRSMFHHTLCYWLPGRPV